MNVKTTRFKGLYLLQPKVWEDKRGYFFESFTAKSLHDAGIHINFLQDNQSYSVQNVIRGLHYQKAPYAQTKLVRVLSGAIWDVAVDLRQNEPTFLQWFGVELSAANKTQVLIPAGFAHGFAVQGDHAEILYKCDHYYHPGSEAGIRFDDPALQIDWHVAAGSEIVSDKDRNLPTAAQSGFTK